MSEVPNCPKCNSEYSYLDIIMFACPACGYEWSPSDDGALSQEADIKDAHGNILQDGDSVTVIKELKIKGASGVIKIGTRVKSIRLIDGDHNIDCKIKGVGAMQLKSEIVKKSK